jgi:hypothetical protein
MSEMTWQDVVQECEKLFDCPDTAVSPIRSNLPNLIRNLQADSEHDHNHLIHLLIGLIEYNMMVLMFPPQGKGEALSKQILGIPEVKEWLEKKKMTERLDKSVLVVTSLSELKAKE